jgi:peptide/nickel transport system permease protein
MAIMGFIKYTIRRIIIIYLIIVIATYLTIVIANMGGYLDNIIKSELRVSITMEYRNNPIYEGYSPEELEELIESDYLQEIKRLGYDTPFILRSIIYLKNALTLNLGRAQYLTSDSGSRYVRNIILERLPQTILLFTTATILNFLINIGIGLYLSRNYGGFLDKLFISLSPTSVIPGWFYGIFLIMIFASYLHILPYGGILSVPAPTEPIPRLLDMLRHMILPLSAWIISSFFLGSYQNRTFFLIFSTEDFVETAKAKGVPPRQIEKNYIFRPALPPIITSLAISLINSWGGAIITESVFNWKGLGLLTRTAISIFDSPVIIGITIIYAYILAFTVLILDILYGLIDPRIKVEYA